MLAACFSWVKNCMFVPEGLQQTPTCVPRLLTRFLLDANLVTRAHCGFCDAVAEQCSTNCSHA